MDIWILYRQRFIRFGNYLKSYIDKTNYTSKVFDLDRFKIENNNLYYDNDIVSLPDLPKVAFIRGRHKTLTQYLENNGVRVINSTYTIEVSRDKLKTYNVAKSLSINQPLTQQLEAKSYNHYKKIYKDKFIIKSRYGQKGNNVHLITDDNSYKETINNISNLNNYIVQQYIESSYGVDLRCYVVGNEIVAYVQRNNATNFMSNKNKGGSMYEIKDIDKHLGNSADIQKFKDNVLAISKAIKADIVAIDFLYNHNEMLLCEVNTSAGYSALDYNYIIDKYINHITKIVDKQ